MIMMYSMKNVFRSRFCKSPKNINFLWNKIKKNLHKSDKYFNQNDCSEMLFILNTHKDQLTNLFIWKYLDSKTHNELKNNSDAITINY